MIHPHFIATDCLDPKVHFSHREMTGVYSHYEFPLFFYGDGERVLVLVGAGQSTLR